MRRMNLPGVDVRPDAHYRCAECPRPRLVWLVGGERSATSVLKSSHCVWDIGLLVTWNVVALRTHRKKFRFKPVVGFVEIGSDHRRGQFDRMLDSRGHVKAASAKTRQHLSLCSEEACASITLVVAC